MAAHLQGVLHVCSGFCKCERCACVLLLYCHLNLSEGFSLRWRAKLSWSIYVHLWQEMNRDFETKQNVRPERICYTSKYHRLQISVHVLSCLFISSLSEDLWVSIINHVSHIFPMEYGIFEWFVQHVHNSAHLNTRIFNNTLFG